MTMRISENYLGQILVGDLNRALGHMLQLQRQAGSMRRINSFADDPRGVAALQRYEALITMNDQYLRNLSRSRVIIEATDTALQDMSALLAEVRELALRESSALATPTSQQNSAIEVDSSISRLLELLNTNVEGNYIFSGYKSTTIPFVRNGDTVAYQGDDNVIRVQSGPRSTLPVSLPGSIFLGTRSATLTGTTNLAPRLGAATALSDLNLGVGVEAGSLRIEDGAGGAWVVDLSSAATIADVTAAIGAATGGAVTAAVATDGARLELTGTGPLTVSEVGDGRTAAGLGLTGTSAAGTLTGRDVRPALRATTPLADIAALDGQLPLGALEVEVAGTVYPVDLSTAATIGDVAALFAAAVPGHELRIDTAGLSVVSGSTTAFTVRDSGVPPTASLLGLQGTGTPVRMFGVLEDLHAALLAGDTDAVRGSLTELGALEELIAGQMVTVGGRDRDFTWAESILRHRDEQLQSKLSLERDADIAQVSADLAQAEMSYQSSLLVASRLYQSNLMMYL